MNIEMKEIENIDGEIIKEYIEEMLWSSYEGFEKKDVEGIEKMLEDLILYNKCR